MRVLRDTPREALQYAASEGFGPLREWVAAEMARQGLAVEPGAGADHDRLAARPRPRRQGADRRRQPRRRRIADLPRRAAGVRSLRARVRRRRRRRRRAAARRARLERRRCALPLCVAQLPESERSLDLGRPPRRARRAPQRATGVPIVEDNPYGDLWYDVAPPAPIARTGAKATIYLGSFSKVLAPGLRLGYVIAPRRGVRQAGAGQAGGRPAHAGLQPAHRPRDRPHRLSRRPRGDDPQPLSRPARRACRPRSSRTCRPRGRSRVAGRCRAAACSSGSSCRPASTARRCSSKAVARGVAFVPGAPFFAGAARANTLRLSFVTVGAEVIERGIAALAAALRDLREDAVARSAGQGREARAELAR